MPTVSLAPLGLGELLDKIFSTFRKHFWLFAGIMVLPQAVMVGLNIIFQVFLSTLPVPPQNPHTPQAAAQSAAYAMRGGLASFAVLIPYFVIYALALGATTYALSEVYLGRTTTIVESYRTVRRRVGRLLHVIFSILLRTAGIFFLFFFSLGIAIAALSATLPKSMKWVIVIVAIMALGGLVLGGISMVIFLIRYSVAVPALILEKLSARQALKRSVALTKGYLWRLVVVAGLMWLISMVLISICQAPFSVAAILITVKGGRPGLWLTIPSLLLGGLGAIVTTPLFMISFAIAYYDLRVRKEGFDLQLMMSNLDATNPRGATGQAQASVEYRLEKCSVLGVVLLSFLTAGIYPPLWFLSRRKALNSLHSPEKIGISGPLIALALLMVSACIPFAGGARWGSWVQAENVLGPAHPLILVAAGIILIVQCFKVRRILLDHLAPREEGMFSASIRFQYDDLLSRMTTFSLGIFYLQYKINGLIDRLAAVEDNQVEMAAPVLQLPALPPINS
jgi:hypothetical protein